MTGRAATFDSLADFSATQFRLDRLSAVSGHAANAALASALSIQNAAIDQAGRSSFFLSSLSGPGVEIVSRGLRGLTAFDERVRGVTATESIRNRRIADDLRQASALADGQRAAASPAGGFVRTDNNPFRSSSFLTAETRARNGIANARLADAAGLAFEESQRNAARLLLTITGAEFTLAGGAVATYVDYRQTGEISPFVALDLLPVVGRVPGLSLGTNIFSRTGDTTIRSSDKLIAIFSRPAPRTLGLGPISSTNELLRTTGIPGAEGVVLAQRTVKFDDIYELSRRTGIEFLLTREKGGFVLRSGSATQVPIPNGVRPIAHTHPADILGNINRLPSRADINVLNTNFRLNPSAPRPVSQIITGPGETTVFRATGLDKIK